MCRKICEQCGREFEVIPSRAETARFCSRECVNKWQSGENNPRWKGGNIVKVCEQCGGEYEVMPSRADSRRCCSVKCMGEWQSKNRTCENTSNWKGGNIVKVCEQCGGEYEVIPSRADSRRCCSVKCMGEWKSVLKIVKTCEQCGGEFKVKPSKSDQRFCSQECHYKWATGKNNPSWKPKIIKTCEQCGKEFEVIPSLGDQQFCSLECMNNWQSGENGSAWNGGISFEPYCHKFNNAFKESIRDKYGRVCFLCPTTEAENGKKLSVHHVNYNKDCLCDDSDCEFVPLCMRCHAKTNHNCDYWENLIMEKLNGTSSVL